MKDKTKTHKQGSIKVGRRNRLMLVWRLLGSKNSRTKKNPGHYKKKTSMGEVAHTFQRISAVRFLKHLRPFRRFT